MNLNEKYVSYSLIFEKKKTKQMQQALSKYSQYSGLAQEGCLVYRSTTKLFKEFLKDLTKACGEVDCEVNIHGRVDTNETCHTYFNYIIDEVGISEGRAQVVPNHLVKCSNVKANSLDTAY